MKSVVHTPACIALELQPSTQPSDSTCIARTALDVQGRMRTWLRSPFTRRAYEHFEGSGGDCAHVWSCPGRQPSHVPRSRPPAWRSRRPRAYPTRAPSHPARQPPTAAHAARQASHRAPPVGSDPAAGAALRQPAGARPARASAQRRACEPESSELGSAPQATQCTAWSCPVSCAVHCTSAEVQLQVRTLRPGPPGGQCGRRMPVWCMPQGPLLPVCPDWELRGSATRHSRQAGGRAPTSTQVNQALGAEAVEGPGVELGWAGPVPAVARAAGDSRRLTAGGDVSDDVVVRDGAVQIGQRGVLCG